MTAQNKYDRVLTQEESAGTKTYHLPFTKRPTNPPQMTIVVKRVESGVFHAGAAICSLNDNFSKREGRSRAFEKLRFAPFRGIVAEDPKELSELLSEQCIGVNELHPGTVGGEVFEDLEQLRKLNEVFDKIEAKQEKKRA